MLDPQLRPVTVIGAGLAGLACAQRLRAAGLAVHVLEASDGVGGRVRSDYVDGFTLDRGFQVLLTAYPAVQELLDMDDLSLGRFTPGSLVWFDGHFHRLTDPWRRPIRAAGGLFSPIGGLHDKLRVGRLRARSLDGSVTDVMQRPEQSTEAALLEMGFSNEMIDRFFRPFLGGVFFDRDLATSSRKLDFVFRMFALGDSALPRGGMGAISEQLADQVGGDAISLNTPIERVHDGSIIEFASGDFMETRAVVIATPSGEANRLQGLDVENAWNSTACIYFDAPRPPIDEPILMLDGDGEGPINHVAVPSVVQPSYAPRGRALVSANTVGLPPGSEGEWAEQARLQLRGWFGSEVDAWRFLKAYQIPEALPQERTLSPEYAQRLGPRLFRCGDSLATASIQGALESGMAAADALIGELTYS